ncbi:MAG TPA: SLBB domain-containing protein [Gemmatimonadales bacterium]|nr:SLBB domain-containing protein [Gemmatimonadales bacterium]HRZ09639.1 SLBB domain-containing protein [Gemmatimonadales bacterium]
MHKLPSRNWLAVLAALSLAAPLQAQQPSPEQVKAILAQPGGADAIRARIKSSGLTPEQIRSRLEAAGYDPALIDPFLTDSLGADSTAVSAEQTAALRSLGLAPAPVKAQTVDTGLRTVDSVEAVGVFGVDVFRRSTTQFLPLLSGPVPPDYRLGPGDMLVLILTGDVELTYQLAVTREGFVVIPQVGQVYLANLTLAQARSMLYDRLGRVYSGVRRGADATTQFDLSVANVRAVQVYVVGEVTQPGAYQMSALGTVLTAIYTAGGVTEEANPRTVEVRRAGATVATFDLYDYLLKGDTRSDVRIENGDVVFVGVRARRVTVTGNVRRPAAYDLAATETLTQLIAAAGGLDAEAARTRISIDRIVPPDQRRPGGPHRVTLDVPLPAGSTEIPPIAMADGDSVIVFGVPTAQRNYVSIEGNVYLPGRFGMEQGLTLSRLVALAGGLQPATYTGRALISRLDPVDQTRSLIGVALPRDSTAPWVDDPPLVDRDSVVIFGLLETRPERTTVIVGAVNDPGTVPWQEGMTLRDLILQAGGLAPGASLEFAEIARLPATRSGGELATTIRVPLDSTYLFDRDSAGQYIGPPGAAFQPSGAPDVTLQPWDNVLIFRQPDFEFQRTVMVGGEVKLPGIYALETREDRVSGLVARSGGLTKWAYPAGVRFVRDSGGVGPLDIDLVAALANPGSEADLLLRPGDRLYVPQYIPSVRIEGAVLSPGSVLWEEGKNLDYYINAAGGPMNMGDRDRAVVRQANGKAQVTRGGFLFFHGSKPKPNPGATVSVPLKEVKPYRDNTGFYVAIASIIASTATIIISLQN